MNGYEESFIISFIEGTGVFSSFVNYVTAFIKYRCLYKVDGSLLDVLGFCQHS